MEVHAVLNPLGPPPEGWLPARGIFESRNSRVFGGRMVCSPQTWWGPWPPDERKPSAPAASGSHPRELSSVTGREFLGPSKRLWRGRRWPGSRSPGEAILGEAGTKRRLAFGIDGYVLENGDPLQPQAHTKGYRSVALLAYPSVRHANGALFEERSERRPCPFAWPRHRACDVRLVHLCMCRVSRSIPARARCGGQHPGRRRRGGTVPRDRRAPGRDGPPSAPARPRGWRRPVPVTGV